MEPQTLNILRNILVITISLGMGISLGYYTCKTTMLHKHPSLREHYTHHNQTKQDNG